MEIEEKFWNDVDENYETLSLCDLPIHQGEVNDVVSSPNSFPDDSNSINDHDFEFSDVIVSKTFDQSAMLCGGKPISSGVITRTKTTSFSSSSARKSTSDRSRSYRKRYILIGSAKFPPKMEMADMRRRQSLSRRKSEPVEEVNPPPVVACGGSLGALVKPVRFRSNLVRALTRMSFGCIGQPVV